MSCAACSARVEKAVSSVKGVESCTVSLLTNSMAVEGTASESDIIKAVANAGYGASKKGAAKAADSELKDTETPLMKKRLIASLIFLAGLMYISMGHTMWGWPLPKFMAENHVAMGILQMLLTITIMVINQKFFVNGFKSMVKRVPNMDALVALGAGAAFVYSTYALFAMTGAQTAGDAEAVMHYMHEFYFESAGMILTLITLGKMLEARSKGKTTDALKSLMKLKAKTAVVVRDGREVQVPIEEVQRGDIFIVKPGENIPVDGIVKEGSGAVDESALTGESLPVDKAEGDKVSAATFNRSGYFKCEATRVGEDTTLSQIIKMVEGAAATKAPIAKAADKVSGIFVPTVITIAAVTIIVWLLIGESVGFALARGISVLVISCPCALGLATPVAIMVGSGVGAKNGILFKTAASLEAAGKVDIAVLDKTGTVTSGEPEVTDVWAVGDNKEELIAVAAALEKKSEHPLAKAVVRYAKDVEIVDAKDFKALTGSGVTAVIGGKTAAGGNMALAEKYAKIDDAAIKKAEELSGEGKTPLFFVKDGGLLGIIAVADTVKPDSKEAISELKNMGIKVVMLTGDNERTARAIGKVVGADDVIAGVLPDGKERTIKELQKEGKVLMVGDGINDAPALTRADIGMAIGAGTDVALDAADIVLMKSSLTDAAAAIRLSRKTLKNIHENLFWAFIYNIIGIPLAAGVWIGILGWQLNPMFGAAAMSLSSFSVVTNALRINFFDIFDKKSDKKKRKNIRKKEVITMEKTMKIEGMMCGHCEARVKNALLALEGVESAEVSHETGTAKVTLKAEVSDEKLKETVEKEGYKVIG